jgi:hypothetical protein
MKSIERTMYQAFLHIIIRFFWQLENFCDSNSKETGSLWPKAPLFLSRPSTLTPKFFKKKTLVFFRKDSYATYFATNTCRDNIYTYICILANQGARC